MAWSNNQLFDFYIWSTVGCSALLASLYILSLVRILSGSNRIPFIVTLCVLLILSNIGAALITLCNYKLTNRDPGFVYFLILQVVSEILRDGCFGAAQWIFSYQYFTSAISIQQIFSQTPNPEETPFWLKALFWVMLVLNVVSPTIYGSLLAYGNLYFYNHPDADSVSRNFTIALLSSKYTIGLEQLISGVFVVVAVLMIRKFLI